MNNNIILYVSGSDVCQVIIMRVVNIQRVMGRLWVVSIVFLYYYHFIIINIPYHTNQPTNHIPLIS